ncbi:MAG: PAS domain S-box protein [Desulfobacteraceae bacterium]
MAHIDKILVVEDAPVNLELLTHLLTERGYGVHAAADGETALAFVRSTPPDLILLDIQMPGVDGFEVCRRLKADERTRAIPVIFISILEDEGDKVKGFQAGAVDYITKPFQPEEVLARVRTHLRLQKLTNHLDQEVRRRTEALATANQRLLASEQLFRAFTENSPDYIARYDLGFRRTYINPALKRLFGDQAQDALGKRPCDGSPLSAPQPYMDCLQKAIETAAECSVEISARNTKGEIRWGHVRFVPEFGPDGRVVSVFSIGRDIHEIKENEQRFRMLAENFPDFVMRFDRDGRFAYVNPSVSNTLEMPADAIMGKTLDQLLQQSAPQQVDAYLAPIRRVFDEGRANTSEARWRTASGERIFEVRQVPEKDAGGNVASVLSIARDITARRQMERERAATLRFFESMDRINRAIQSTNDLERMMSDTLGVVLEIFDCDRAFLLYPCDPRAQTWQIPMERTKPEYPGARDLNIEMPKDPQIGESLGLVLASGGPMQFGTGTGFPLPEVISEQFEIKNSISMALHPKQGQPWLFGLHQCAHEHICTMEEERLFQEIARRMEDALTGLMIHRNLGESEKRYRMVFENSPVSIWEEDFSAVKNLFDDLKNQGVSHIEQWLDRHPETVRHCAESVKIIDVNQAAVALHGAADKEALFGGLTQIFMPESLDTFRRALVCLWNEGTGLTADSVVKTLAGERRDVTVYFSVCPGHEQTLSKVFASRIDITDRKRNDAVNIARLHLMQFAEAHSLEPLLEETLNQVKRLTGSLTGVCHFVEEDQKALTLRSWSTGTKIELCKTQGDELHYPIGEAGVWADCVYQRKPVIHNDCAALAHPDGMPEGRAEVIRQLVVPVMRGEKIVAILGVGNKPGDYTEKDVEVVSLMADLAWEIAERKRAQEELDRHREHLEELVHERTAELEASNKELQDFTYSVSHDLRAPLRHIDGFMELLQEKTATDIDEQGRHYMDAISGAAKKMGRLIDELLAFTWMGRHLLSLQRVALKELVRDILGEFEPETAGRRIDWRIGDLPVVNGDAAMLRIVLGNLIANALKFTRPRQEAQIEIGSQPGQNAEAVIFVRDNGVGFDMTYADKLFGVFQRLHGADQFEGTGIGLANVRRIIARHGGRTWAQAEPGQGAIFFFSLPHTV